MKVALAVAAFLLTPRSAQRSLRSIGTRLSRSWKARKMRFSTQREVFPKLNSISNPRQIAGRWRNARNTLA